MSHNHDDESGIMQAMQQQEKSNRFWIGEFTDQLAQAFSERVLEISGQDESKPIILYINSGGGDAHAMLTMMSVMDSVPNSFVTVAVGQAASAGAMLLAHGDIRFVAPYSRVMIHEISAGAMGHIDDLETTMKDLVAVNTLAVTTLAKNMGKTLKQLKEIFKERGRDMYLTPQEAVEIGLADHVGVPTIKEVPISATKYEISLQIIEKPGNLRREPKPAAKPKRKK